MTLSALESAWGRNDDANRMPLPTRDFGNLEEQPLACGVLEAGFDNTKFHGTCRTLGLVRSQKCALFDAPLG
jgi:hypothetical protein